MLKSIDILIGLSVVMLMVSLIVTVLTGAVTNLLQTRGRNLLAGITGLLRQIHPDLSEESAQAISAKILTHPMIRSAGEKFGSVIHREELSVLLLELASGDVPSTAKLEDTVRQDLCELLKKNGIEDPAATMANVRSMALTLEQAHPELSNNARIAMAFLQEANSRFLAKVNGWFDQTIDRVADRFTNSTRIVTFVASLVVALVLQLDTAALVGRLNADPVLRQNLVEQAVQAQKTLLVPAGAPATQASPQTPAQPGAPDAAAQTTPQEDQDQQIRDRLQFLSSVDVIEMPGSLHEWVARWESPSGHWPMKLLGIIFTALLLSLGAPFWYNALKNLIRLRSLIAQKDDDQRATRQQTTAADGSVSPAAGGAGSLVIAGERGDLTSLG